MVGTVLGQGIVVGKSRDCYCGGAIQETEVEGCRW